MEQVNLTEQSKKDKSYKVIMFFIGILLISTFFKSKQVGTLIVGIVFIFYSGFFKEMIVKKDGIHYTYKYFFLKRYDKIVFDDLVEIVLILEGKRHLAYFKEKTSSVRLVLEPDKMDEMAKFIRANSNVKIRVENLLDN